MDDATKKSLKANEKVVPESEVKEMRKRIIRDVVDERPTYGYRRVTARLNRAREQ